jgi:hypothetical protein
MFSVEVEFNKVTGQDPCPKCIALINDLESLIDTKKIFSSDLERLKGMVMYMDW